MLLVILDERRQKRGAELLGGCRELRHASKDMTAGRRRKRRDRQMVSRAGPQPRAARRSSSASRAARRRSGSRAPVIEFRARATRSARSRRGRGDRQVVVDQVAAEVGGVVGVDGDRHAGMEQALERVLGKVVDHAQAQVRERAHREGHVVAAQPGDQLGVVDRVHAVVDAPHAEHVERFGHVVGRALLAGVGDGGRSRPRVPRRRRGEVARRMADLGRVEADAGDQVARRRASRRTSRALLGLSSRKKHMMRRDETPSAGSPSASAAAMPRRPRRSHAARARGSAGRRRPRRGARRRRARGAGRRGQLVEVGRVSSTAMPR